MYSISTLRRRAHKIGYHISKGFKHYLDGGEVWRNVYGEPEIGYTVTNMGSGCDAWGSYDFHYDNLWTIEDVEEFLKKKYEKLGLTW